MSKKQDRAYEVSEAVFHELLWQGIYPAYPLALNFQRWIETGNPHYIDAAMLVCQRAGIEPTQTMRREQAQAAEKRIFGAPPGTANKLRRENLLEHLLILMANMIFQGESLRDAARRAQTAQKNIGTDLKHYKASSLERYYAERWRNSKLEREFFTTCESMGEKHAEIWRPVIEALPKAPEHESGNRRD